MIETKYHALELKININGDNLLDIEGHCNLDCGRDKDNGKSIIGMMIY